MSGSGVSLLKIGWRLQPQLALREGRVFHAVSVLPPSGGQLAIPALAARPRDGRVLFAPGLLARRCRVGGIGDRLQLPGHRFDTVHVKAGEAILPRLEEIVVVHRFTSPDRPSAIQRGRQRGPAANDPFEPVGLTVRVGEDLLLQTIQKGARHQREDQQRRRRAVEADTAGPHDHQLAVLGHQANRDQRREQHGHRNHEVDKLRSPEIEEPQEHAGRGVAAEQVGYEIDERRDVEERQQRHETERQHPDVCSRPI